jgi:hypothetical protein
MIIHASDRVEVRHEAADSGVLWVFFTANADAGQVDAVPFITIAQRAGAAVVHVKILTSIVDDCADSAAAIEAIRAVAGRYRSVVALGDARGGAAALCLGDVIGADTVLAFAPTFIAPVTNAFIFRDPYCRETGVAAPLMDSTSVGPVFIPMPFAGGDLSRLFASTPKLTALIDAGRAKDMAQVRRIANHARRRSPLRIPALVNALLKPRPRLADRIKSSHFDRFAGDDTKLPPKALQCSLPRTSTLSRPTVITVFGSCRVYNPSAILAADGRAKLNQANIFGFVHCAAEVLQQLRLISGETPVPARLRPYLNIGENWRSPFPATTDALARQFDATDVFVVEVSSIRHLRFKAFLLQINRTRELLAADPEVLRNWWTPLLKTGQNNRDAIPDRGLTATALELMEQVTLVEEPASTIRRDIEMIARRLGKPVLFVSHFNVDMAGAPIAQRRTIVEAFAGAAFASPCAVLDPTDAVIARGIDRALADGAHYQADFERELADVFAARIAVLHAEPQRHRQA